MFALAGLACLAEEPAWQPALASGEAPECPAHTGTRLRRSEIIGYRGATAFIFGSAVRGQAGCRQRAVVKVNRAGSTKTFALPDPAHSFFSLVDFSPSGSQLLLQRDISRDEPNEENRDVEIAVMPVSTGAMQWHNAWDIFGWQECDAMVEPQGFTADGRVVLRVRKSVMVPPRHADCVKDVGLYAVDLTGGKVIRLPDSAKVERVGHELRPRFQPCKSDPDIVDACFTVHGRLRAGNGTPTLRIWRVGTKRILGVHDDIIPENLAVGWDVEAYGDYLVCPFTKQRPGEMQMVCVESAQHVVPQRP
jgi:hypothetical protein